MQGRLFFFGCLKLRSAATNNQPPHRSGLPVLFTPASPGTPLTLGVKNTVFASQSWAASLEDSRK